jgi:hypothetical protein
MSRTSWPMRKAHGPNNAKKRSVWIWRSRCFKCSGLMLLAPSSFRSDSADWCAMRAGLVRGRLLQVTSTRHLGTSMPSGARPPDHYPFTPSRAASGRTRTAFPKLTAAPAVTIFNLITPTKDYPSRSIFDAHRAYEISRN